MKIIVLSKVYRYLIASSLIIASLFFVDNLYISLNDQKDTEPIFHGNIDQNKVAFVCNVFWGEEFLPDMLKTLEDNNVHITFFIGGTWAKDNPDILKNIVEKGHEVANHSYNHPHPNTLSKDKNKEQILKAETIIQQITGVKTSLYAPPYGEYNDVVLSAAQELDYKTIMWSIDTIDWKRPPSEIVKSRVLKKIHNGAIVLMHPTEPTKKALPELLKELREKGYIITTVSDVIN
jgi:probable sporulation protein (polysaccharide deacetylase family)